MTRELLFSGFRSRRPRQRLKFCWIFLVLPRPSSSFPLFFFNQHATHLDLELLYTTSLAAFSCPANTFGLPTVGCSVARSK